MNFVPLHCHSALGSMLDGLSRPEQIAKRISFLGYPACALTDHGTIHAIPSFFKEMAKVGKKAIAGCELYICQESSLVKRAENRPLKHLCILSKSKKGWQNLVKAVSLANKKDRFYYKPRLSLEEWSQFAGEWIVFTGHPGSHGCDCLFSNPKAVYDVSSIAEAENLLFEDAHKRAISTLERFCSLFGAANVCVEIQLIDRDNLPAQVVASNILREVAKRMGLPAIATADSHYPTREDAADQRVLLSSALNKPLKVIKAALDSGDDVGLAGFFLSNNYHIPTIEDMAAVGHTDEELKQTLEVASRCEEYSLNSNPMIPSFTSSLSPNEELAKLAREGWKKKIKPMLDKATPKQKEEIKREYGERMKHELAVLEKANLASYFLIVRDYAQKARKDFGALVGPRGSAAGCLAGYLLDITPLDPVRHKLLFSRFFDEGRIQPGKITLPDYDLDFPPECIEPLLDYLEEKYGKSKVARMSTFQRIKGRNALKTVLKAHSRCSFQEQNEITMPIPDEAAIADDLQEMLDESGESSIILWALENKPDELKEWCFLQKNSSGEQELCGPLANDFRQAIRLEGLWKARSTHASGVIICSEDIETIAPVFEEVSGRNVVGFDMRDCEDLGLVKFDILRSLVQTRIGKCVKMIRENNQCL